MKCWPFVVRKALYLHRIDGGQGGRLPMRKSDRLGFMHRHVAATRVPPMFCWSLTRVDTRED